MKATGPNINKDFGGFDRPRAIFSSLPVGLDAFFDSCVFVDDFVGSVLNATDTWAVVKDAGAAVAFGTDLENGAVVLTSAATTDNDGASIQTTQNAFLVKSGKKLWFEARVKVSDADQCDMFIGLAENHATNPENAVAAGCARVGFELVDGSALIRTSIDDNTSSTVTATSLSMSDDTYVKLGFRTDGASVRFYVNRALVSTSSIPTAIAAITLGPTFFNLSGDAVGTHTATCDYIAVAQER